MSFTTLLRPIKIVLKFAQLTSYYSLLEKTDQLLVSAKLTVPMQLPKMHNKAILHQKHLIR